MKYVLTGPIEVSESWDALNVLDHAFGRRSIYSRPGEPKSLHWANAPDLWFEAWDEIGGPRFVVRGAAMELWFTMNMPDRFVKLLLEAPDVPD